MPTRPRRLREVADTKNQAEAVAYQTERSLKEHRSALEEADAATIEGRVMELRQALRGDDVGEIRAKTEALQEASHKLAEAVYAISAAAAASTASAGGKRRAGQMTRSRRGDYEVIDEEQEAPKA